MVCSNKKNDSLEELVTIDNLAAQIKEIYMSTPKTRGIDKLEGWREVAEYVIVRAGIPSKQDYYPEECEHGDWVSRKVEDSSQFTCLDCGQNCWVENQIKDC